MHQHRSPWFFHPQLAEDRLTTLAESLLNVLDDTYLQLSTPLDDNYTRGTCTFGRQRQQLIQLCQNGELSWLKLTNPGMDITFEIEGIPVRFFADDPENPQKPGFFRRNEVDQLWAPEFTQPTRHRFVVEKPEFEGEGARVHFVGYNELEEIVSRWTYGDGRATPVLHTVDKTPPASVPIELDPISVATPSKDKKAENQ